MTPKERAAVSIQNESETVSSLSMMRTAMQQALMYLDAIINGDDVKPYKLEGTALTLREALAEPELNLNCKSVQKRLATSWGYVKAEQAEQEPIILKFPRQKKNCWTIDWKTISSVEDAIEDNEFKPCPEGVEQVLLALEKVYPATQPVQEPVAWFSTRTGQYNTIGEGMPLYTHPIRTKDLSDDEIADALYGKGCWRLGVHPVHLREYRRVIQADRELNK